MYKSLLDNMKQLKSFIIKEGVVVNLEVQEKIADFRKHFWSLLTLNHIILNKIANLIGLFESHEATLGDVVYHLNNLRSFLNRELDSFALSVESKAQFIAFFDKRFDILVNEYTCLANVLHPKYWSTDSSSNLTADQITTATQFFLTYAESFGHEADELIEIKAEFFNYIGKNGPYSSKDLWSYKTCDPFSWWRTVYEINKSSKLHLIATKLLAVRPSNCDVERNFSIQKNTHTKLRNRLGDGTVEKLVSIKQFLTTGSKSKKQPAIDFDSDSGSD